MGKFVMFTKRTEEPKLGWLEERLDEAGIPHRRNGSSFHAPILEVEEEHLSAAWEILTPVDDIPDDDPRVASAHGLHRHLRHVRRERHGPRTALRRPLRVW